MDRIPRRTALQIGFVSGTVALAGCASDASNGSATEYPPGISDDGIENIIETADAHHSELLDRSFTRQYRSSRTRVDDPSRSPSNAVTITAVDGDHVHEWKHADAIDGASEAATGTVERWTDGDERFVRDTREDEVVYGIAPEGFRASAMTGRDAILRFLDDGQLVGTADRDGRVLAVLLAAPENGPDGTEDYRATALIRSNGVAEVIEEQFRSDGSTHSTTTDVTKIGSTTVGRPEWYEAAAESVDD